MLRRRKFWKRVLYVLGFFVMLLFLLCVYVVQVSKVPNPIVADTTSLNVQRTEVSKGFYTINDNWFRKSSSGLYELYVAGDGFEMGVINGKLTKELVQRQEDHFIDQIRKMVPSTFTQHKLKYLIGWFNRNLDKIIKTEYRDEIFGVSKSADPSYQWMGSNYQRILNYHAAHDIGHALQNLALVGCTSFGTWNNQSADSTMIIGRNFDFYVGDAFAEDKIVAFFAPKHGHKFMTVTWGGFIGAVSGMNDAGLTVTINAAKSEYPTAAATPVSLVTREILQYAQNISEAIAIAKQRKMFVSESFLVASAADNKAVVIEKTPDTLAVYDPNSNTIICTNHFQSTALAGTQLNQQQVAESASQYRYNRLTELLAANGKNTVAKTVAILRDRKGLHGADIGDGNEKAINQLIAHHSIVFEPQKRLVWVSTAPWQLGKYVAYDLHKIFELKGMHQDVEIAEAQLAIPADTFLQTTEYRNFENFRKLKQRVADGGSINTDSLVSSNPAFYNSYIIAGDYWYQKKDYQKALPYYNTALTKTIATMAEQQHVQDRIVKIKEILAP